MNPSNKVIDYSNMTPRGCDFTIKSATTAKKHIEDSEAQTPGLKQMKIQGLRKSVASDDEDIPAKKKKP